MFYSREQEENKRLNLKGKTSMASFTLVELLITIAILAILAATVVIVIDPSEMLSQARDATRLVDLKTLKKAISMYELDNSKDPGLASTVYISLSDSNSGCSAYTATLPTLPAGWVYRCATAANLTKVDGNGWVPGDFRTVKGGSPLAALPIDPVNSAAEGTYYSYIPGGSFVVSALLQSEKSLKESAVKDGGTSDARLEVGTDLNLWRTASGLKGYWRLDGGSSGTIANGATVGLKDESGNNNDGTASNVNGTGMSWVAGKRGGAITFDGVDDFVNFASSTSLNITGNLSLAAWVKPNTGTGQDGIIGTTAYSSGYGLFLRHSSGSDVGFNVTPSATMQSVTTGKITYGQWNHVVATYNGTTLAVYVNGVRTYSGAGTSTSVARAFTGMTIGNSTGISAPGYFRGAIDEVRVYDRVLTAMEVTSLYKALK